MSPYIIGIDFGATKVRIAWFDLKTETMIRRTSIYHVSDEQPEQLIGELAAHINAVCSELKVDKGSIHSIVVGLPALHNDEGDIIIWPNVPQWNGWPFKVNMEQKLELPVTVVDDAQLASIGEYGFGLSKNKEIVLTVTVGTGVGGGLVCNGITYGGASGHSMEIGHLCVEPKGLVCSCGSVGCLQLYASGRAIERQAAQLLGTKYTSDQVFALAADEHELAAAIIDQAIYYLALGISNSIKMINPSCVVVGGGVVHRNQVWYESLGAKVKEHLGQFPHRNTPVYLSRLGDDAALWGAPAYVRRHHAEFDSNIYLI